MRDDEEANTGSSWEEELGGRHWRLEEHRACDRVEERRGDSDGSGEVVEAFCEWYI